jgi:hypothetical protein
MSTDPLKSTATIVPAPPRSPQSWSPDWAEQLNRWLINYIRLANFPAVLRGGRLYLPSLPASGYGLIVGEVYRDGNVLKVVLEGNGYMGSVAATGFVGTLTVTV